MGNIGAIAVSYGPPIAAFSLAPTSTLNVRGAINACENNGVGLAATTFLYGYTNPIGSPINPTLDGFRFRFDWDYRAINDDYLIIEKTDGQSNDPDGGIVFQNTGADNV
jgi:hypothetical protein